MRVHIDYEGDNLTAAQDRRGMNAEADVVIYKGFKTLIIKAMPKVKDEAELERVARDLLKREAKK